MVADFNILKISPGIVVAMSGLVGLLFVFIENSGLLISKIPLSIFFIFLICLGIVYEIYPKNQLENFGEIENQKNQYYQ